MEILTLRPTVKKTLWGGRKLIEDWGFETSQENAAECWLLSCHKDGPSFVKSGTYEGKTLAEVLALYGKEALGTHCANRPDFPVLIKLIDARDRLSVQVHPGDEYARRVENENGKTEAWYILDAEPGAELIYGVNKKISRAAFRRSVEDGSLDALLNRVSVKPGDVVFIPSGMLHAIGAGILLAEVQQSSNTTYRVYDYLRRDADGKLRELHVQKAGDVVDLNPPTRGFAPEGTPIPVGDAEKLRLTGCEYFTMTLVENAGTYTDCADGTSFVSLLVLEGEGELECGEEYFTLRKGDSLFIPASHGEFTVTGNLKLLETRI